MLALSALAPGIQRDDQPILCLVEQTNQSMPCSPVSGKEVYRSDTDSTFLLPPGLEWVPTKYRAKVVSTLSYCATAGQVLLAGLAYGMRSWRGLQLAISAPFFCFFAYSW